MEDYGGIVGSFQLIFTPLATYSSILMSNFLLNNNFVHEDKSTEKSISEMLSNKESHTFELTRLRQFRYTFCRYICSKMTNTRVDNRYLALRRRGEQRIEQTLDVEMLLKYSKLVRVMSNIMFKSKFEQVLAASQRQQLVLTE